MHGIEENIERQQGVIWLHENIIESMYTVKYVGPK